MTLTHNRPAEEDTRLFGQPPLLRWSVDRDGAMTVVTLVGELDMSVAAQVRSVLADAIGTGGDVVVDLGQLTFMDSSGLAAFGWAHKRAGVTGRSLKLCGARGIVRRAMHVAGLDRVFVLDD